MTSMHFIGLDIHKKTISYCVKDVSGKVLSEGTVPATRIHLDLLLSRVCCIEELDPSPSRKTEPTRESTK